MPAKPAVFLLRPESGEPYISKTANLRRRLIRLLGKRDEHSRLLTLRDRAREIEYFPTGSDFESGLLLYKLLRREFPKSYRDRLRLRPAPLVKFHWENEYPRVSVTTQLGRNSPSAGHEGNLYYGPFASRASAEKFSNDALDFFKLRRCVDDLHPDPAFPGCIYSEMKMCLAPCFRGCSDDEYLAEATRVQAFFDSRGQSLARELSALRDRASEQLAFEEAAALHTRIEKLQPVLAQLPEITRRIDRLDGLMIQPSAESDSVNLFRIHAGCMGDVIPFPVSIHTAVAPAGQTQGTVVASPKHVSMEARILASLASTPEPDCPSRLEVSEQIAMLKRWYFRSNKTGELFLADSNGELPMRRIVRAVARVFRGEKPAADLSESTRDYWVNRGREVELNSSEAEPNVSKDQ
ncbi:MAG: UvrB/UvrC motif-containing protein [Thermomicrobiales bacterium]